MRRRLTPAAAVAGLLAVLVTAGCGSGGHEAAVSSTAATTTQTSTPAPPHATSTTVSAGTSPGALQAEANSAAAGDIPDNQVFLVFVNHAARYSMKYPEGWAQQGSADQVTFRDKNNIVRIVVGRGPAPTQASVRAAVAQLRRARVETAPRALTLSGRRAFKVVYGTESAPNSVTGKRVKLVVDRYYLWNGGRRAVVDLGTPQGVDNVDAYRLMIESFRWR
jgi:hypothetical protein